MFCKPNLKTLGTFFSALILFVTMLVLPVQAGQMSLPKTAKVKEEIKVVITPASNKNLELTLSSRALKEAIVLKVPANRELILKDLPAGHYLVGLREEGQRKFIEMGSLRILEVLK